MKKTFDFRFLLVFMLGIFMSLSAVAQQITVKGHVQDQTGEPVVYATVAVLGTNTLVNTDVSGNFNVKAQAGADLRISYIGCKTVVEKAKPTMLIVLQDNSTLKEAVVIGYGVAKKNDLTGSVTAIKPDEKNRGMVVNAQDLMKGKIAGVNVTPDGGTPGAGASIRIRGGSSLNASNNPLIVIDGLAMDNDGVKGLSNPLSMVNPADIATFTVLKDASATAIYGSRGSNGVIIITTKKGIKKQAPKISYNGYASFGWKQDEIDVMNGNQYRQYITDRYGVGSDAYNALGNANTDWQDEIYRMAVSHDHNLTIAGGLKNMPYRMTLGYTNQQGILKNSDFERFTVGMNLNPSFFDDHLKINANAKYMLANSDFADQGAIGAAVNMDPTQPVRSDDPKYKNFGGYFMWTQEGSALKDPSWPLTQNGQATRNPVAMLNLKDDQAKSQSFVGNLELDYQIHGFEDLRLHMNFGGDFSTGKQETFVDPASPSAIYYGWNGWDKVDKYNLSYNAYAQYYKDFNEKHHFDIMGGYEWQHFRRSGKNEGWGMLQETNTGFDAENAKNNRVNYKYNHWKTENYLVSFFGRANYSLLDRYLFTATCRYDGSSRFKDHWALFPSFAFAWKMKNEAFLKDVDAISDMKLRLGYGQTGQQEGIGDYNWFTAYNVNNATDSYYPIIGEGQIARPFATNKDLTWETTETYNAGFDLGFFNQRFTASVDYYFRKTTDLLNTVNVSAGSNFNNRVMSNIGSMENQGVEVALNWKALQSRDWFWDLGFNVTYNHNEITEISANSDGTPVATGGISSGIGNMVQAHAKGHPASSFYVYQQVFDSKGQPIEGVYVDRNADGKITSADKYFYKSPMAPWTAGFSSKLQYKDWDFGFTLRASFGNFVYNDQEAGASNMATVWSYNYLGNRPVEVMAKNWQTWDNVLSDYFVQNGSFLKCDNITLGYSFRNLFKGGRYDGISGRAYVAANNVFTITKYKGIDPEVMGGIDNNMYPRPFTFMVGLNLNF